MTTTLTLPDFVARWQASTLTERSAAQSHFIDLCEVLGQPRPAAVRRPHCNDNLPVGQAP